MLLEIFLDPSLKIKINISFDGGNSHKEIIALVKSESLIDNSKKEIIAECINKMIFCSKLIVLNNEEDVSLKIVFKN